MARIRPALIRRLGIDENSMGGAMSAYWFMHDAAALRSLGAKPPRSTQRKVLAESGKNLSGRVEKNSEEIEKNSVS
jgi:hypothetical protein